MFPKQFTDMRTALMSAVMISMLLPLGMPAHPSASATLGGGLLAAGRSRRTSEATVRLAGVPGDGADGQKMGGACLGWLHVSVKMECQSMLGSAAVCPFSPPATLGLKWIL